MMPCRPALRDARSSLAAISRESSKAGKTREHLIRNTRDVVILCSQAIILVHGGDIKSAAAKASKAHAMLKEHQKKARGDLGKYLALPEQELVEAQSLVAIAQGGRIPGRNSLGVSGESYALGLLDCVGELKRMTLDCIRCGRLEGAEQAFAIMEELFNMLYPLAMHDKIIKDARRKIDSNRIQVEGARAALTEEIRRTKLMQSMSKYGAEQPL